MADVNSPGCASCGLQLPTRTCYSGSGKGPDNCPTLQALDLAKETREEYSKPDVREFARLATVQEGECYLNRGTKPYLLQAGKTRIQEICEFAQKIGAEKIGLAFCMGLVQEARVVDGLFKSQGFEVVSVICKVGHIPKEEIGIKDEEKINIGSVEAACNPIFQAKALNEAQTGLNVVLGLCVGHDSLFFKYAEAYTTVLAVKDRVTGHNPLAPIYTSSTYYSIMRRPGF